MWRFAGGPMMARHVRLAWYMCSFEVFYGIWTRIAKKYIFFVIFQGGGGVGTPRPPFGSAHD